MFNCIRKTIMFLLKELIRFSTQHRTFYCYLILSIWIFLLIAGMYKYVGNPNTINSIGFMNGRRVYASNNGNEQNLKYNEYSEHCTPIESIHRKDDGGNLDGWKLQGVLLVIRHGDRGPMSHVRGISSINCGTDNDVLLNRYKIFLQNTSNPSQPNHMYWNKIGPFHQFALLPLTQKSCLLGQLTYKGISQLLHLGEIMQQVYLRPLNLFTKYPGSRGNINSTPHTLLNSDEVIVYSTRYRRTFQSAMALMFSFLPQDKWLALNILESHSMAFCFSDCACSQAENLRNKLHALAKKDYLTEHNVVSAVVQYLGQSLLLQHSNGNSPHEVLDAILALVCHNATLPCKKNNLNAATKLVPTQTAAETNDVINIDQDEIPAPNDASLTATAEQNVGENDDKQPDGCIEHQHIATLMTFNKWQSSKEAKHVFYKRIGLLRAYGMIRHIVSYMLKMISGDRTKFVLYSGHDWTMQYLTAALGIDTNSVAYIAYASRMAFEVYRSDAQTDYYFRVIYNGKDVTKQIDFCEGGKSLRVARDSRGSKADLCPIENIIRFLHDDYFSPLNATNFKDACVLQKSNEL